MMSAHGLAPKSICDIGCGTAGVLARLQEQVPDVQYVGYEPAGEAIELAGARASSIDIRRTDAQECRDFFDLILMLDVFEHVEDYVSFIRSFTDKASKFIFHIPLDMSVQAVVRMTPIMEARTKTGHLHYFSKETALATVNDGGYRVLDWGYTNGTELPRVAIKTRLAAIPRRLAYRLHPDFAVRVLGGFSLLVLAEPSGEPRNGGR